MPSRLQPVLGQATGSTLLPSQHRHSSQHRDSNPASLSSASPSAAQAKANQKFFVLLWIHPEDIYTVCVKSRDCKYLFFLLVHRSLFAAAEVALYSRSVGLRSRFQLCPKKRPGFNSLSACLTLFFCQEQLPCGKTLSPGAFVSLC